MPDVGPPPKTVHHDVATAPSDSTGSPPTTPHSTMDDGGTSSHEDSSDAETLLHTGQASAEALELRQLLSSQSSEIQSLRNRIAELEATVASKNATIEAKEAYILLQRGTEEARARDGVRPCQLCQEKEQRVATLSATVDTLKSAALQAERVIREKDSLIEKLVEKVREVPPSSGNGSQAVATISFKDEYVRLYSATEKTCCNCKGPVSLSNWFRCNSCQDCNYCRKCFNSASMQHANGYHAFTDMSVLIQKVVDTHLPHITRAGKRTGAYSCDVCGATVFPNAARWFRCNVCEDSDLCSACFETHYDRHFQGLHSFTDMSTLVRSPYGFPTIVNTRAWKGRVAPYNNSNCDSCGRRGFETFFHCNDCEDFDLCPECVVTNVWHDHANCRGRHTFTYSRSREATSATAAFVQANRSQSNSNNDPSLTQLFRNLIDTL